MEKERAMEERNPKRMSPQDLDAVQGGLIDRSEELIGFASYSRPAPQPEGFKPPIGSDKGS
jgi:hypothetical protein